MLNLLLQQHLDHRDLFDLCEKGIALYQTLRSELIHHVNIEEQILFKRLLELGLFEDEVKEAWDEHKELMDLLKDIDSGMDKFRELRSFHFKHIESEEDKFFSEIRKTLSEDELKKLEELALKQIERTKSDHILYPKEPGVHETPPTV